MDLLFTGALRELAEQKIKQAPQTSRMRGSISNGRFLLYIYSRGLAPRSLKAMEPQARGSAEVIRYLKSPIEVSSASSSKSSLPPDKLRLRADFF